MITSSIVFYKTELAMARTIIGCADKSCIERIYVIDNSPTDALREGVSSLSPKVEYIFGQGNVGYGSGHNIGIRKGMELGAKYHIVLNPDIRFDEGAIEKMESFSDSHPEVGALMPMLTSEKGDEKHPMLLIPSPFDIFGRRILPKDIMKERSDLLQMNNVDFSKPRNVPQLSGCFMFMRVDVLKQVGLFDERFFMYFEDFDLERRIHKVSKTVVYPCVKIVHVGASEHRVSKRLLKISIQSAIKYYNKWGWLFDSDRRKWNKEAFEKSSIVE